MRSTYYQFTLPVVNGEIQDPNGELAQLRCAVRQSNARRIRGLSRRRHVLDLKYRGPRLGNRYNTPRDAAHSADVYLYWRRVW